MKKTKVINLKKIAINALLIILGILIISTAFLPRFLIGTKAKAAEPTDTIDAKSYVLACQNGEVLRSNNEDKRFPVASMVKTMTLLLAFEDIRDGLLSLDQTVVASDTAQGMGGSQVFIGAGEEYTVDSLLKAIVVASGNDACVALAETISGSESEFVKRMNERANSLGLKNTHFANATGLPSPENYSCARDMAIIMSQLRQHAKFFEYASIWMDTMHHANGRTTEISNTNKMIRQYNKTLGGKTGSTQEAGFCVVNVARDKDLDLIAVVIGSKTSKDRFDACAKLFNYGFANYEAKSVVASGDEFVVDVLNSRQRQMTAVAKDDFKITAKKGDKTELNTNVISDSVKAPVLTGNTIGQVQVLKEGAVVASVDLVAKNSVEAISFGGVFKEIVDNFVS